MQSAAWLDEALPPRREVPTLVTRCSPWPPAPRSTWAEVPFYLGICALGFLNWGLQKLITAIYADYARSLKSLGFKQGAVHFASKAGVAGRELLNELGSPKEELTEGWHVLCWKSNVGSKVWGALAWLLTVAVKVSPDRCEDLALVSCGTTFLRLQVCVPCELRTVGPTVGRCIVFILLESAFKIPVTTFQYL